MSSRNSSSRRQWYDSSFYSDLIVENEKRKSNDTINYVVIIISNTIYEYICIYVHYWIWYICRYVCMYHTFITSKYYVKLAAVSRDLNFEFRKPQLETLRARARAQALQSDLRIETATNYAPSIPGLKIIIYVCNYIPTCTGKYIFLHCELRSIVSFTLSHGPINILINFWILLGAIAAMWSLFRYKDPIYRWSLNTRIQSAAEWMVIVRWKSSGRKHNSRPVLVFFDIHMKIDIEIKTKGLYKKLNKYL